MKKVININFQGRVIPIEEIAYDILKQYVESLRRFFANEDGRDEIINDIEGRIAELFGETLKKGSTCITEEDVERIIDSMGRPEDFEDEEASVKSQLGGGSSKQEQQSQSSQQQQQNSYNTANDGTRRLYRDENRKVLGGVCSGLANYFGIDATIVRILCILAFGITFIPYLILWVAVPGTSAAVIGSQRKRLFRDPDDKVIAGVCSGLSQYFGVSVWIPRLLFLIPFFSFIFRFGHWGWWDFPHFLSVSFSPGSIFVYVVLWLVLPEAKNASDRLEMKGEKVDLNNIKNTIQGDLEGFSKRAEQWGKEVSQKAQEFGQTIGEKGMQFGAEAANVTTNTVRKSSKGLGDVIAMIAKIFAYFVIGCVLFALVAALFSIAVVSTGLLPAKDFVVRDGWQSIFAWGTLFLFIWVPVVGAITFIIRRLTKTKGNSGAIRFSFISLWLVGLFCFIGLLTSLYDDVRYRNNPQEQVIKLTNPATDKLEVKIESGRYYNENWFKMEPFASFDDDTVYVRNIRVRIVKSRTDSFQVKLVKLANGKTKSLANETAAAIQFNAVQIDSTLILDKGIPVTREEKFRNQHVVITISVPVGKRIRVGDRIWDNNIRIMHDNDDWWSYDREEGAYDYNNNVDYIMTEKGLKRVNSNYNDDNDNNNNVNDAIEDSRKSDDQLKKAREEKLKELQKIDDEMKRKAADTTRYHYQPAPIKPAEPAPAKTKATAKIDMPVHMTDLLMLRLSI